LRGSAGCHDEQLAIGLFGQRVGGAGGREAGVGRAVGRGLPVEGGEVAICHNFAAGHNHDAKQRARAAARANREGVIDGAIEVEAVCVAAGGIVPEHQRLAVGQAHGVAEAGGIARAYGEHLPGSIEGRSKLRVERAIGVEAHHRPHGLAICFSGRAGDQQSTAGVDGNARSKATGWVRAAPTELGRGKRGVERPVGQYAAHQGSAVSILVSGVESTVGLCGSIDRIGAATGPCRRGGKGYQCVVAAIGTDAVEARVALGAHRLTVEGGEAVGTQHELAVVLRGDEPRGYRFQQHGVAGIDVASGQQAHHAAAWLAA
jgi:hypothetical protein